MKRLSILLLLFLALPLLAQAPKGALATLIEKGDRKAALERIRAGADVNDAQPDGTRAIHWAVQKVDYEILGALLAKKPAVNIRNEFGVTPIAMAAEVADARMVKMLLDAGAEVEGANPDGQTAMMLAIKTGEVPVVEMLIKAGANVNTVERFHKQTPLMWAVSAPRNAGALTKLLLSKGADLKVRASDNDWPSQITSEPRAQYRPTGGLNAMLYAARDGCYDCVDALIAAGADLNLPTPDGITPMMLALDNDHNDVAKLLLDKGANPRLWDWWGRTALYIAIDRKEFGAVESPNRRRVAPLPSAVSSMSIINALLAAGVDVNAQLNAHRPSRSGNNGRFIDPLLGTGCTPLLRAALGVPFPGDTTPPTPAVPGDVEVVRVLLANGANPHINAMGVTPFLVAAGVNAANIGGTGLAATHSWGGEPIIEMMEMMLQRGANVNDQVTGTKTYSMRVMRAPTQGEGRTALHMAAYAGRVDIVRYLLSKGANPELKDADGKKAIDMVGIPIQGVNPNIKPASAAVAAEIKTLLQNAAAK